MATRLIGSALDIPNCVLDLDAGLGVAESAGVIPQWNDQSVTSNHFTQGNGANRPARSIYRGLPVVAFDGVNDAMVATNNIADAATGSTIIAVCRKRSAVQNANRGVITTQSNGLYLDTTAANGWAGYSGGMKNTGDPPGTNLRVFVVRRGLSSTQGAFKLRADGINRATFTTGGNDNRTTTDLSFPSQPLDMDLAELLVYGRSLSDGELVLLEQYLTRKWNLAPIRVATPTDIQGTALWLDAKDEPTITRDGSGLTSQWADKSGNAAHATEALPANQPTYTATGFDGFPALDWGSDGAAPNRRLATPAITYLYWTAFFALKLSGVGFYVYAHQATAGSVNEYFSSAGNPHIAVRRGSPVSTRNALPLSSAGGTAYVAFLRDNVRHIVTRLSGPLHAQNLLRSDRHLEFNQTYSSGADPGTASSSTGPIFVGNGEGGGSPFRGVIGEELFYNRQLTDGEICMVEQYMSNKWALVPLRVIASPLSINDCLSWLVASQGVTLDGTGGVLQWNDLTVNGYRAEQPGFPERRPVVAMVGSTTVIRFDGIDDCLQLAINVTTGAPTIFAVARLRSDPTAAYRTLVLTRCVSLYASTTDAGNLGVLEGGSLVSGQEKLGTALSVVSVVNDWFRYLTIRSRKKTLRRNVRGASLNALAATEIGATGGTQAADLDLAELIIYNRPLTDGEVVQVEQYLTRKYNL